MAVAGQCSSSLGTLYSRASIRERHHPTCSYVLPILVRRTYCSLQHGLLNPKFFVTFIPSTNMSRIFNVEGNVHLLSSENNEIGGFYQNGSVSWSQIEDWMHTVYSTSSLLYACSEEGDPQNPAAKHVPAINKSQNEGIVPEGYYILLSPTGTSVHAPSLTRLANLAGGAITVESTHDNAMSRPVSHTIHPGLEPRVN